VRDPDAKKVADMIELMLRDRVRNSLRTTLRYNRELLIFHINGVQFSVTVQKSDDR
jgi:hypothetical protein